MNSDIKILKLLLDNKESNFTIRKISESLGINYRIAYEKTHLLEKEGLIKITKIGNSKISKFLNEFDSKVFEAEYERRNKLLKKRDFLVLHKMLADINFCFIALLFGSQVRGNTRKYSDIDILFIGGDERKIKSTISLLPDKVDFTHITEKEFIQMLKSKEFTVVSEAVKNNIILIGIEEYYRLLRNAR